MGENKLIPKTQTMLTPTFKRREWTECQVVLEVFKGVGGEDWRQSGISELSDGVGVSKCSGNKVSGGVVVLVVGIAGGVRLCETCRMKNAVADIMISLAWGLFYGTWREYILVIPQYSSPWLWHSWWGSYVNTSLVLVSVFRVSAGHSMPH